MKNLQLLYRPTLATSLLFLLVIGVCLYVFVGRNEPDLRITAIEAVLPEYQTHFSNFAISYMLVAGIGYLWLMRGLPTRSVLALGAVVVVINWIYERFIPVINVPDTVDAWYGTAGTALGLAVLLLIQRFGLRPLKAVQV